MSNKIRKFISGIFILCFTTQIAGTVSAQYLGGTLLGTTIVDADENPWSVYQTVIIPEGDTLIIEAGVQLNFTMASYIEIRGTLIAVGTSEQQIYCNQEANSDMRWGGIRLVNATSELDSLNNFVSGSILEYININDASEGLILSDSSNIYANNLLIQNCSLNGITLESSSRLISTGLSIQNCTQNGIALLDSSHLQASDLYIKDCSGNGISLINSSVLETSSLHLENCSIGVNVTDNSKINLSASTIDNCSFGISFYGLSENNIIRDCQISHCFSGIMFLTDSSSKRYNLIENCNISYNSSVGIFISATNSAIQHNTIRNNTVSFNRIGLHIGNGTENDNGYNLITDNKVHDNDFGIKISQSSDTIINNYIANNFSGILLNTANNNHITKNIILNNSEWGIKLEEGSDHNRFEKNNLIGNQKGIIISYKDNIASAYNSFLFNAISETDTTFIIQSGPQEAIHYNNILSEIEGPSSFINEYTSDVDARFNYWGTSDTVVIADMIHDIYDDPQAGEVIYKPVIHSLDPAAPISKPIMVYKRLINNAVTVTWRANKESDLAGYKVYYAGTVVNTLLDTLVIIPDILLTESIKVTANDVDADGIRDQVEGHESDFAVAVAAPWAGSDGSICSGDNFFTSIATAIDYNDLTWSSDGDGTFADAGTLHTYYVPGSGDISTGSVNLKLRIITSSGVELFDELELKILDLYIFEAGNDSIITEGSKYITTQASASNYTTLLWLTSGDGVFSDYDSIYTEYTPGIEDNSRGWVVLTLKVSSGCGTAEDNFRLDIIPGYDIRGTVSKEGMPVSGSVVIAFNTDPDGTRAVTTTESDYQGVFMLPNISEGQYYIFAVPDPSQHSYYLPTYYAHGSQWQQGYLMPVNKDVYDVDITLSKLDVTLPTGEGSINGNFVYEGQPGIDYPLFNRNWFNEIGTTFSPSGDHYPAANHTVLLMNPEVTKVVGWALSGLDGSFSFSGLPYGAYRVWGEKAGYESKLSPIIYITPDNPSIEGVELSADIQEKVIEASAPPVLLSEATIYPNPSSEYLNISAAGFESEMTIQLQLIDQKGIIIKNSIAGRNNAGSFGPVDLTDVKKGIYMCKITSSTGRTRTVKVTVL